MKKRIVRGGCELLLCEEKRGKMKSSAEGKGRNRKIILALTVSVSIINLIM